MRISLPVGPESDRNFIFDTASAGNLRDEIDYSWNQFGLGVICQKLLESSRDPITQQSVTYALRQPDLLYADEYISLAAFEELRFEYPEVAILMFMFGVASKGIHYKTYETNAKNVFGSIKRAGQQINKDRLTPNAHIVFERLENNLIDK